MKSLLTKQNVGRLLAVVMTVSSVLTNVTATAFADSSDKKIDVWDFGGATETNTELYNNIITTDVLNNIENVGTDGKFKDAEGVTFGDLKLTAIANDRLYYPDSSTESGNGTKSAGATNYKDKYSDDEYSNLGVYYANGTGGDSRRCVVIDNVKSGETLTFYGGLDSANSVLHCLYTGDGQQDDTADVSTGDYQKISFIANYDGQYKLYFDGSAGKPRFARVTRTPAVAVTGTLTGEETDGNIVFRNETTGVETQATLSGKTFTVSIAPDYDYTALLRGVAGYAVSADTKKIKAEKSDIANGLAVTLKIKEQTLVDISGKISGFASDYDTSKFALSFVPTAEFDASETAVAEVSDGAYTAKLEPEVDYNVVLEGVNDYETVSKELVNITSATENNIEVKTKDVYEVSGNFDGYDKSANLTFTNMEDSYSYEATVTGASYQIQLRNGDYEVTSDAEGYVTKTHVSVNGKNVSKDIYFLPETLPSVEYAKDVYVGVPSEENNYDSVKDAISAINRMTPAPSSEADRITVHIAPGTYRSQVILTTPYVSLVNTDPSQEVKLTWYYGIGYSYYSVGTDGYYDEARAVDKFLKPSSNVSRWGGAFYIKSSATDFYAENIVFENSFNKYVTEEEIADGVAPNGAESITFERKIYSDVTSKTATERAAAILSEADRAEFYNCSFLGSQDTLFVQEKTHQYFNNCFIEGNTDYIFGDGDIVFESCQLNFAGYSDSATGGYITAMKDSAENGVLFRDCYVTASEKLKTDKGYFGRPWGQGAKVYFVNTVLKSDIIAADGWTKMSAATPENANFYEAGTVMLDGSAVDTSSRKGNVETSEGTVDRSPKAYFGDWTPSTYSESYGKFTTKPFIISDDDLNTIYAGHTLTVGYELDSDNDSSVIRWYRVDSDGNETFISGSRAYTSKSYTVTSKDAGYKIKVVVIPQIGSSEDNSASYTTETEVKAGSSGTGSTDKPIEDAVNIFIAGDSTVKTYTTSRVEGGWGEYLRSFFNSDYVNIVNYANGGRSSRNFINEGSLEKIKNEIKEGDYLLIQFAHNDCANGSGYLDDRFVSVGEPDENGIYPTTEGVPGEIPTSLKSQYDGTYPFYPYTTGTFKWYLKQYIEVAQNAGATPVLVTPVTRMYFNADGTIYNHHDATDTTTSTVTSSGNAYVTAVKQLGEETGVAVIDMFEITKAMAESAYKESGNTELVSQIMAPGEKTHCNKLGGLVEGAYMAEQLKELGYNISEYVTVPSNLGGEDNSGNLLFYVDKSGNVSAYAPDSDGKYTVSADYWNNEIQKTFTAILGTVTAPEVEFDFDDDGVLTANDVASVVIAVLSQTNDTKFDIDGNGTVTSRDALLLMQKVLRPDFEISNAA